MRWVSWIIAILPENAVVWMADCVAFLARHIYRKRLVKTNISYAISDPDLAHRVYKESYRHFFYTIFEFVRSYHLRDLANKTNVEASPDLDALRSEPNGAFILCTHLGNWETMIVALSKNVRMTRVIVKKIGNVNAFVEECRRRNGFNFIERRKKGDAIAAINKAFKAREFVGFPMDQYRPGEPEIEFFGRKTRTNSALAGLSIRFGLPVYIVTPERIKFGQHVVRVKAVETKSDKMLATREYNRAIEEAVLACPDQYLWLHRRWR